MINRDRAWRRRKARTVFYRTQAKQDVLYRQIEDPSAGPAKELKQHRHGALTHIQAMRLERALGQELQDGADPA
jgi:hypothetical protein